MEREAPARGEYEFDDDQNAVFSRLAGTMRFVGGAQLVGAAGLLFVAGLAASTAEVGQAVAALLQAAVLVASGVWTLRAARAVGLITSTEGHDIHHLMRAMVELSKLFELQRVLIVVALTIGLFGLFLLLTVAFAGSA